MRNWSGLSESYRRRLVRAGITEADYQAGVSLKAARGHAPTKTPKVQGKLWNPRGGRQAYPLAGLITEGQYKYWRQQALRRGVEAGDFTLAMHQVTDLDDLKRVIGVRGKRSGYWQRVGWNSWTASQSIPGFADGLAALGSVAPASWGASWSWYHH
jgi:hypothetical protein